VGKEFSHSLFGKRGLKGLVGVCEVGFKIDFDKSNIVGSKLLLGEDLLNLLGSHGLELAILG